jgi:hypothetical protein
MSAVGAAWAQDTSVAVPPPAAAAPLSKPANISLGLWEGQRSLGTTISTIEGGGFLNWEAKENLNVRFQISYLKGSLNSSSTSTGYTDKDVLDISGFPIQICAMPTIRIGDRFLVRAGGGLSYYKFTVKETSTYSSVYTSGSSALKYGMSGLGGQFLIAVEGKINPKVGVEAQYERGTAKMSYKYTVDGHTYEEGFGLTPEAYRVGVVFHL